MKILISLSLIAWLHLPLSAQEKIVSLPGLQKPVEIITDNWGVPHIYAQTEIDLFFAQGYQAAKDRLFQLELFRRRATGTMAELFGIRELKRDIGARLFQFRGNMEAELNHYHPKGKIIIRSFVNGINAYVKQVLDNEMLMPMELQMLNIKPGYWTTEVVISRHNGLLSNVQEELETARLKIKIGEERLRTISNFHPLSPDLQIDSSIDASRLNDNVLEPYRAFRAPFLFKQEDIAIHQPDQKNTDRIFPSGEVNQRYQETEGSNNWVIAGKLAENGFPLLANDPHRAITTPSLRYMVHLSAPGWNVIGGGEPVLPGVSIGHNEYGAWGLTIFETDAEDLYVYKLKPGDPTRYFYKGGWKSFKAIKDTILVRNQAPEVVTLFFSLHGPVTFIDSIHNIAYAVKCGWLEKGCAPYLASLRMNQAKSWEEFRAACSYSFIPAENMVWADRRGHIGWQTVGIAPVRQHHSGMVPVPGDGRFEWSGYLPVLKRPGLYDPETGFICTANESRTPPGYSFMNTIGFSWADPYRHDRIKEVLGIEKKINTTKMQVLQTDYYSLPAKQLIPLLKNISVTDSGAQKAKDLLVAWDLILSTSSVEASIYVEWENCLKKNLLKLIKLDTITGAALDFNTKKMIDILCGRETTLTGNFILPGDSILVQSLTDAMKRLTKKLGSDITKWQYGQEQMKHVLIRHPFSSFVNEEMRKKINLGPVPRGGNANTVNSTGNNLNQASGASFRIVIDCFDWDLTMATNSPGQNGDPQSSHYRDLFELWSRNQYFPLYFTKSKIERVMDNRIKLIPR
jgi:penicillin G amidase